MFVPARMSGSRYDASRRRIRFVMRRRKGAGRRSRASGACRGMGRHSATVHRGERFQTEVGASASRHPHFVAAAGLRSRPSSSSLLRGRRRSEIRASTATTRTATVGRKRRRAHKGDGSTRDDARRAMAVRMAGSTFVAGRTTPSQPASNRRERRRPRLATANPARRGKPAFPPKKRAWTSPGPGEGARGYIVAIRTSGGRSSSTADRCCRTRSEWPRSGST